MAQAKDIKVTLGDVIKTFPAGTSEAEIDSWVTEQRNKGTQTASQASELPPGASGVPSVTTSNTPITKEELFPLNTTKGIVQRGRIPISAGAGIAAGAGSAASGIGTFGSSLAASGAMGLTDSVIDRYLYNKNKFPISEAVGAVNPGTEPFTNPIANTVASGVENTLGNEAIGRLANIPYGLGKKAVTGLGRGLMEAFRPGSLVDPELASLKPTLSQYLGDTHPLVGTIENIFTREKKGEALETSAKIAMDQIENKSKDLVGRKLPMTIFDPTAKKESVDQVARRMRLATDVNYTNLTDEIESIAKQIQALTQAKVSKTDPLMISTTDHFNQLMHAQDTYFKSLGDKGLSVRDLLKNNITGQYSVEAADTINEITNNWEKTKKFLTSGELTVNGKTITSASPRKDLQGFTFMKFIQDAYDSASGRLNTSKLQNAWNDYKVRDVGREIFNQNNRADISNLFDNIERVSTNIGDKGASKYLTLRLGTGTVALGTGLIGGAMGGTTKGLGTAATIVGGAIGLHQFGKLMTNPNTARLLYAAASGGSLNMSTATASRIIGRALRNESITMETKDDKGNTKQIPGKINALGQFVPDENN